MQQMVTCPNCGSQNAANQQFCVSCGAHLGGPGRPVSHVPIVTGVAAPSAPIMAGMIAPQPMMSQAMPAKLGQSGPLDVKPTWGLAWGLFWRMLCLLLFMGGVLFLIYMLVRMMLGYNSVFGGF
jgi:hypothetical protein